MKIVQAVLGIAVLGLSGDGLAQRREELPDFSLLEIELPQAVKFGETTLPASRYRLALNENVLAFFDPTTMVLVANIACDELETPTSVKTPSAETKKIGTRFEIKVRFSNRRLLAVGTIAEPIKTPGGATVIFPSKQETSLKVSTPEDQTDSDLVQKALSRYGSSIKHCGDKAQARAWTTDHPKFLSCVCPIASKWRFPPIKKTLQLHHMLVPNLFGLSLVVTPEGKVFGCRVWAGPKPPASHQETILAPINTLPEVKESAPVKEATPK